jgi:hypothetical protein
MIKGQPEGYAIRGRDLHLAVTTIKLRHLEGRRLRPGDVVLSHPHRAAYIIGKDKM